MPLPTPKGKEKRGDFVSRCIGDKTTAKDFPDQKQRIAICYSQWEKARKAAGAIVGSGENEVLIEAAQKTYNGKKRSELKDSDFLFPETRSFPIVSPKDVTDAIHNFGRMSGNMSYDEFIKKLYKKAKSKGQAFVDAIPESTKKEHKLSASEEETEVKACDECGAEDTKLVNIEIEVNVNKDDDDDDNCDDNGCDDENCNDDNCENQENTDNCEEQSQPTTTLQPINIEELSEDNADDSSNMQSVEDSVSDNKTINPAGTVSLMTTSKVLADKMGISCMDESTTNAGLESMNPSQDPYFQNKVFSNPGDLKN